jgi:hypothetical protein
LHVWKASLMQRMGQKYQKTTLRTNLRDFCHKNCYKVFGMWSVMWSEKPMIFKLFFSAVSTPIFANVLIGHRIFNTKQRLSASKQCDYFQRAANAILWFTYRTSCASNTEPNLNELRPGTVRRWLWWYRESTYHVFEVILELSQISNMWCSAVSAMISIR